VTTGTRTFFFAALGVSLALVLVAVVRMPAMQGQTVPEAVSVGLDVWRRGGCEGCHALNGQGGGYAPDLTHITSERGAAYLRQFMIDPGAFHVGGREMPRIGLTVSETENLISFLQWVDDEQDSWPPQSMRVGAVNENAALQPSTVNLPADPAARGRYWFTRPPAACAGCHSLEAGVVIVGPSLAGVASRAASRVDGESAADYLRESILHPSAYVVEGFPDSMPHNFSEVLSSEQIDDIIAFLLTLE
jgi:nitric oxide reductase subunit C